MTSKKCSKCNETKPIDEFYRYIRPKYDYPQSRCKQCVKDAAKLHDNRLSDREHSRRKRALNPRMKSMQNAAYKTAHPDRIRANTAIATALRSGTLTRKDCEKCGAKYTHAHHKDYSRPLDVQWLCPSHHKEAHVVAVDPLKELNENMYVQSRTA